MIVIFLLCRRYGSHDAIKSIDFAKHVAQVGEKMAAEMQAEQDRKADAEAARSAGH